MIVHLAVPILISALIGCWAVGSICLGLVKYGKGKLALGLIAVFGGLLLFLLWPRPSRAPTEADYWRAIVTYSLALPGMLGGVLGSGFGVMARRLAGKKSLH